MFGFFFPWSMLLCLGMGACAYSVQRRQGQLAGIERISGEAVDVFVPVADNLTMYTGMEGIVSTALRDALAGESGLRIKNSPKGVRYFLIPVINHYSSALETVVSGSASSESRGGVGPGQQTVGKVRVTIGLQVDLVEQISPTVKRAVWSRSFVRSGIFDSLPRWAELEGASSAPHVNQSRERLQVRALARDLARQVLDQVVQDF